MVNIIRIFLCLMLAFGWAEKTAMANDAADDQIQKEKEIEEARGIFEAITQKSPSETIILEFIKKSGVQGKDAIAVAHAIRVYALSSKDAPEEKAKTIKACADNNPDNAAILYECAQALEYSQLPANQRNRDVAVEKLLSALPQVQSDAMRQELFLRIARLYGQSFDSASEQANHEKAAEFYKKALELKPRYSLECISARMELADIIALGPDHSQVYELYHEVIHVDPELIVKEELTPALLKQMSVLQPREIAGGMTEDSPTHQDIINRRIQQFGKNTLEKYSIYRRVALKNLAHQTYVDFGVEGLKKLEEAYKQDEEAYDIITGITQDPLPSAEVLRVRPEENLQ